jgi:hypothetical protein
MWFSPTRQKAESAPPEAAPHARHRVNGGRGAIERDELGQVLIRRRGTHAPAPMQARSAKQVTPT